MVVATVRLQTSPSAEDAVQPVLPPAFDRGSSPHGMPERRTLTDAEVLRRFRAGIPVRAIASELGADTKAVADTIKALRVEAVRAQNLQFIPSPEFQYHGSPLGRQEWERRLLDEYPASRKSETRKAPSGLPRYLAALYETSLLTPEQERYLFRKLNYLKYKAGALRDTFREREPQDKDLDRLEALIADVQATRNLIIKSNLRLVISVVRRIGAARGQFDAMVSEGNMSLLRACEKFDYGRGNRFSSYATVVIQTNFSGVRFLEQRRRVRERDDNEAALGIAQDTRSNEYDALREDAWRKAQVAKSLGHLNERDREILTRRFGLDGGETHTLQEIADQEGRSKERIRQLEARALDRFREALKADGVTAATLFGSMDEGLRHEAGRSARRETDLISTSRVMMRALFARDRQTLGELRAFMSDSASAELDSAARLLINAGWIRQYQRRGVWVYALSSLGKEAIRRGIFTAR